MSAPATLRVVGSDHARPRTASPGRRRRACVASARRRRHRRRARRRHAAAGAASLPSCNLAALASHKGVVDITFWESAVRGQLTTLQAITNTFNSSQSKVHVTLVDPGRLRRHLAEVPGGPDQRPAAGRRAARGRPHPGRHRHPVLPARAVLHERGQVLDQRLPAPPLAYWKVNGVQWALPFAVSAPVLYYNQNAFTKAGLNPTDPPTTLAPDARRRQGAQGLGHGHGAHARPAGISRRGSRPPTSCS